MFAFSSRITAAAEPWMALRYGGDAPHFVLEEIYFVLEEISCPSCATLLSVREVRRSDGRSFS